MDYSAGNRKCRGCERWFETVKGRKIHQTKKRCGLDGANVQRAAAPSVGESSAEQDPDQHHSVLLEPCAEVPVPNRIVIQWPKSSDKQAWRAMDEDLSRAFDTIRGKASRRAEVFAGMISQYGVETFGTKEKVERKQDQKQTPSRRLRKIDDLKKERRRLRAALREEENEAEREAVEQLVKNNRRVLSSLMRAERHAEKRREAKRTRKKFTENPFKFAKAVFNSKTSGELTIPKTELELVLEETYHDASRESPVVPIEGLVRPTAPGEQFNSKRFKLAEVEAVIKKARAKAAGGPNGVTYAVYKNCPFLTKCLWKVLARVWDEEEVPASWCIADGIYIPKEENSSELKQFRPISLINVEGKVFFAVLARRLSNFLLANGFIDTSVQKAGIPGFPGCLEHVSTIWANMRDAQSTKEELHVVWLDLANAYPSVPHRMILFALDFFHVPTKLRKVIERYFNAFRFRFSVPEGTTRLIQLQKGIAMGCTISPLLFVMVIEIVLKGCGAGSPLKAFMDDMTLMERTAEVVQRRLERLNNLIRWCSMKFKAQKSRTLSLVNGRVVHRNFFIGDERIPTVREQPVKSLGRWYCFPLTDRHRGVEVQQQAESGLKKIENLKLPGRFKVWIAQFALLPRLMWPLTVYEVALTRVEVIEGKISTKIRKWLGVPRMLTSVALYGKSTSLSLPFASIVEEYKVAKVRLQSMLQDSSDRQIRQNPPVLQVGKKWNVLQTLETVEGSARQQEVRGTTQSDRGGLGLRARDRFWSEGGNKERRKLREREVRQIEEESRRVVAAQQGQQGRWLNWEIRQRKMTWPDVWSRTDRSLKWLLQMSYDVCATPTNLVRWGLSTASVCHLCGRKATLHHILCACPKGLAHGWYTFRHNLVLEVATKAVEAANVPNRPENVKFVKEGVKTRLRTKTAAEAKAERRWQVRVDRTLPFDIAASHQRPDLVLIDDATRLILLGELTVPWEESVAEAHERKLRRYDQLKEDVMQNGWKCEVLPFEVGARGFCAASVAKFLAKAGVVQKKRVAEEMSRKAEEGSAWIWKVWNDRHRRIETVRNTGSEMIVPAN